MHQIPCRRVCSNEANVPCRLIYTNKAIVPADLQSAGIKYKDFSIRLLPIFLINRYESRIADPYI